MQVATSNGTASAGSDYTTTTTTLNFAPGETSKTVTIPILDDNVVEGTETLTLTLSNPSPGAAVGTPGTSTISILDDESQLLISIGGANITEGDSGTSNANFVVQLSNPSSSTVTAKFATQEGTATAPSDYTSTSGTLTFAPGETTKTISVPVVGDTRDESNENFFVRLSDVTTATVVNDTAIGVITDNDGARLTLSINDVSVSESDGAGEAVFTVTLATASDRTVTVQFATSDGSASAGRDYQSTSGTLTFNPGVVSRTISVPITGDTAIEGSETFFVTLSNATTAVITDAQGVGTITDNDQSQAAPSIVFTSPKNGELTTSLNAVFGTVSSVSPSTVTVRIQREADRRFFSGRNYGLRPTDLAATLSGTTFSLPVSFIPRDNNLRDGKYNLTATATDADGRSATTAVTVHVDQNGPRVTFSNPLNGARLRALPVIAGRAVDPVGGTGTAQVILSIKRSSDGKFFSGRNWSVSEVGLSTELNGNTFVRRDGLPTGANLKPDIYFISAVGLDRVRNRGVATVVVVVITSTSTDTTATPTIASGVKLSTATASAAQSAVRLTFTGALQANAAGDASNYTVLVNGATVDVEGVAYSNGAVSIDLGQSTLKVGDAVVVGYALRDAAGKALNGTTSAIVAR